MKQIIIQEKIITYTIVRKPKKHVYFRLKDDHIQITAHPKIKESEILSYLEKQLPRILKLEKKRKTKVPKYQLWGQELSKEAFFKTFAHLESDYEKILIKAVHLKLAEMMPQVKEDLKKLNLGLVTHKVKKLKSKFGSCHMIKKEIILNSFLARLDPIYLYYVLMHEYAHFIVGNHSPSFYQTLDKVMNHHQLIQKNLRKHEISF